MTSGVNTRHKLQERDPKLAELMTLVYGDGDWRYPQTAPHKFAPCEESSERQHGQQAESSRSGAGAAMQRPMVQVVVLPAEGEMGRSGEMLNPLLALGAPGSGVATRRTRRGAGSPARQSSGSGGGGSKLAAVPRRITRAFARLAGCCLGPGL